MKHISCPLLTSGVIIVDRALRLTCVTKDYKPLWESCSIDGSAWDRNGMFLSFKDRRTALVEMDVLAAMALGIDLSDLIGIYSSQFNTLAEYEAETYYDQSGRIVFTTNRNLSGSGFSRPEWNNIKDMKSGTVPRTITDDILPGGPQERTITYTAPFDKCDREADYATAWTTFEKRGKAKE